MFVHLYIHSEYYTNSKYLFEFHVFNETFIYFIPAPTSMAQATTAQAASAQAKAPSQSAPVKATPPPPYAPKVMMLTIYGKLIYPSNQHDVLLTNQF